jgi:hypothetical protein
MTTRWLTPEEQRAWRAYIAGYLLLEDAIDRQLQQEAGMPHAYYSILANLSDAPERRLRMTDLAERLPIHPFARDLFRVDLLGRHLPRRVRLGAHYVH